jgi:hypothetical protein
MITIVPRYKRPRGARSVVKCQAPGYSVTTFTLLAHLGMFD